MNSLIDEARKWAVAQLEAGAPPSQIDLDQLSDETLPSNAVAATLACASAVRDLLAVLKSDVDVAAVLPLDARDRLVRSGPTLDALSEVPWDYGNGREVPGIYLVRPSIWGAVEPGEEYRRVLDDSMIPSGFFAYYRTWRTPEELARGWEFSRAIYLRAGE